MSVGTDPGYVIFTMFAPDVRNSPLPPPEGGHTNGRFVIEVMITLIPQHAPLMIIGPSNLILDINTFKTSRSVRYCKIITIELS
jgi:hypothetical protein